jgi:hypothetical protein
VTDRIRSLGYGALAAVTLLGAAPARAAPCDVRDVACTKANARVASAIQAQPDLAEIAGYAEERRALILSHQTSAAKAALNQDERLFRSELAGLLTGDRFEGAYRRLARERLQGRLRSLDRMSAVSDQSVVGYWENSGGAVELAQAVPGMAAVTYFKRDGDGALSETCQLTHAALPDGKAWTFGLPGDAPLTFTVHDGALWVGPYRGRDACARAIAGAPTYFAARPELHVPSPR